MLLSDLLFPQVQCYAMESGCRKMHATPGGLVSVQGYCLVTLSSPLWSTAKGHRAFRTMIWIEEVLPVPMYSESYKYTSRSFV